MKEFVTAAKARGDEGKVGPDITTKIDGKDVTFHSPTSTQFALWMTGIQGSTPEAVAAMINFFFYLLAEPSQVNHFRARLWDPKDDFDEVDVANITKALIEEWSGKATPPSSDSAPQPSASGQSSTAPQSSEESTPSTSVPTAS